MNARVWFALGGSALFASACSPARSAQRQVIDPRTTAICLGNEFDAARRRAGDITRDAAAVCGSLRRLGVVAEHVAGEPDAHSGTPPWPVLGSNWATGPGLAPARLLFYEGNGLEASCDPGTPAQLCLIRPRDGSLFPFSALAHSLAPRSAELGWTVLVLNTCDSGFADVRAVPAPSTLIGSGFGAVPRAGYAPTFANLLTAALVTPGTDRNCDGVVTDHELALALNKTLKDEPASAASNPVAVVRRHADADVPVVWTRAATAQGCDRLKLAELVATPAAAELPCALQNDFSHQSALLAGRRSELVERAVRYVFLSDERSAADQVLETARAREKQRFAEGAQRLGFSVVEITQKAATLVPFLEQVGPLATFTDFYLLTLTDRVATLGSLRDGEALLTLPLPDATDASGAEALLTRLWRCLPSRIKLVGTGGIDDVSCRVAARGGERELGDPCQRLDGTRTCFGVRVDGRFPITDVRFVRWSDFPSRAAGGPVDWTTAEVIPCRSTVGQCFRVRPPSSSARVPSEWLLLDDGARAAVARAEGETCEH